MEKSPSFMQMLIETCTNIGGRVLDLRCGTGILLIFNMQNLQYFRSCFQISKAFFKFQTAFLFFLLQVHLLLLVLHLEDTYLPLNPTMFYTKQNLHH